LEIVRIDDVQTPLDHGRLKGALVDYPAYTIRWSRLCLEVGGITGRLGLADFETVVVGAGVVGLAVAHALTQRGQEVLVVERHPQFGFETSSRNSEVIHSGLYYSPGSLRARLCVSGREMLYRFAEEHFVPVRKCGKLLVATRDEEIGQLLAIEDNARRSGVSDLVRLDAAAARAIEPELNCVAATLSPSTGVIDSHLFMAALEGGIVGHGGLVVYKSEVSDLTTSAAGEFRVQTVANGHDFVVSSRYLVIAAGLNATCLGKRIGSSYPGYRVPETYHAKGHYFTLNGRAPFGHLVYPMPTSDALGIHFTLDVGGSGKFGPDISWQSYSDYSFEEEDERKSNFIDAITRYWPNLRAERLSAGYTGIRPKIYQEGSPAADFAIHGESEHGLSRLVTLYGIESPGLTSSLAIGEHVARMLLTAADS
jgi:L-2-hydroxyglutarate oxidase LhgO